MKSNYFDSKLKYIYEVLRFNLKTSKFIDLKFLHLC